ncbi:hypothetical protein GVAV_001258 [Gurleya vavrai]
MDIVNYPSQNDTDGLNPLKPKQNESILLSFSTENYNFLNLQLMIGCCVILIAHALFIITLFAKNILMANDRKIAWICGVILAVIITHFLYVVIFAANPFNQNMLTIIFFTHLIGFFCVHLLLFLWICFNIFFRILL